MHARRPVQLSEHDKARGREGNAVPRGSQAQDGHLGVGTKNRESLRHPLWY